MKGLKQSLYRLVGGADGLDIAIHNIDPPPRPGTMPLPPLDPRAPAPLNPPPGAEPVRPPPLSA